MYRKLLMAAGLLCAAGPAWSQVAAPSLVPGNFTGDSPAVIKWAAPSEVGLLAGNLELSSNIGAPVFQLSGYSGGLRLVGNRLALAVDSTQLTSNELAVAPGTAARMERGESNVQAAVQLGNRISIGFGQASKGEKRTVTSILPGVPSSFQDTQSSIPSVGLGLRLGEWVFIGVSSGKETRTVTDPAAATTNEREVNTAGFGIRTGGTVLFHAELFSISKPDFFTAGVPADGESLVGATLEVVLGKILVGYNARTTTFTNNATFQDKKEATIISLGWLPHTGLAIAARMHTENTSYLPAAQNPTQIDTLSGQVVAISYRW